VPNSVNWRKHGNNLNISKNFNFTQKTKEETLFTEVPNRFYKSAKLFPVSLLRDEIFYFEGRPINREEKVSIALDNVCIIKS
jgi:hypothetical protein